jgi:TnpA family transposase
MPSLQDTAYPRLKTAVTARNLAEVYTPTAEEVALAHRVAHGNHAKLSFLVLLKTFQRLGYFVQLREVPTPIIEHIARSLADPSDNATIGAYDESGTRRRHVAIIRDYLQVNAYGDDAQAVLAQVMHEAAYTKEDLVDLINIGIEELVRQRFELPGFTTLARTAQQERTAVNQAIYEQVARALEEADRQRLDQLLVVDNESRRSTWNAIKDDPGQPTLSQLRRWVKHLQWLGEHNVGARALVGTPEVKIRHFAADAKSLDAARVQLLEPQKRYTLMVALIKVTVARTLDDLGEMFIKRMKKIHDKGEAALKDYLTRQQGRAEQLVTLLHDLVATLQEDTPAAERLAAMQARIGDDPEAVIADCRSYTAYTDNNYMPFLWPFYRSHRKTLFTLFDHLQISSTSQDRAVEEALGFVLAHRASKAAWLPLPESLDLSWVSDKWWKPVTGLGNRKTPPQQVDRRQFEVCVFSQVMWELKSGDLCIEGSDHFTDYRTQLISWEDYHRTVEEYGEQVGLPVDSRAFVAETRRWLEEIAAATDASFPGNKSVRFENGELILSRLPARPIPKPLKALDWLIAERLEPINILDVLADTERWLNWTRFFGPLSGYESRVDDPRPRYVTTAFCYGCNMGPTQTARSLNGLGLDRRQIAWIHQRHITEDNLQEAITAVINAYNRFILPKRWGSGKSASVDGTKWDLYEQNLLAEHHIRYGGYGGIGYYHVSDTYIALFSHFIPCGVWEAIYILDGLINNKSDIQPEVIHGDTQAQSTAVYGLAHLLGIKLMPRIRNWKELTLFRPSKTSRYQHIDALFSDTIDWPLIETHLPDMLRVVLSIKAGRITASTLLRKLGAYSKKNKLYQTMRELGRVYFARDKMKLLRISGKSWTAITSSTSIGRLSNAQAGV